MEYRTYRGEDRMGTTPLIIKVPGKLMIAGEYAVLEKYQTLVAMAVDRFVYATITTDGEQVVDFVNINVRNVSWQLEEDQVMFDTTHKKLTFAKQAMEVSLKYLREQQIEIQPFALSVRSELDDASGVKYGLGSSAAVTTAIVTAILHAHLEENPTKELLFRLSAIAHVRTQGTGSGADIAASVYGGMIEYTSFQADWLLAADERVDTITELIQLDWPYASVQPVTLPEDLRVYVGWTGTPASTVRLVDQILLLKETDRSTFDSFLQNSEKSVQLFLQGMRDSNHDQVFRGIEANRVALAQLGVDANVPVETPLLYKLHEGAVSLGGAGKLSGAGGGDCGIAFLPQSSSKETLFSTWEQSNIYPLQIQLTTEGAVRL